MAEDDSPILNDDIKPTFYIGHHDSRRTEVSSPLLQQAQDCNYDMLTVPLTTPFFNLRVLNLLLEYFGKLNQNPGLQLNVPVIVPFSALDTNLGPGDVNTHLLGVISPWIDLSSPDPIIYELSRQVFHMEVAYAAFCGIGNLILPSPRLHYGKQHGEGIAQYACAVLEALEIGGFIQFSVSLPMMDNPHDLSDETKGSLASQARIEFTGLSEDDYDQMERLERTSFESQPWELLDIRPRRKIPVSSKHDYFGTWDAWNTIRSVCKHNHRLFVALSIPRYLPPATVCSRWYSEPLRLLQLGPRSFYENKSGYPVLHKEHKALLIKYMRLRNPPWIVLCDAGPIPGLEDPEAILEAATGSLNPMAITDSVVFPSPAEAQSDTHSTSKRIEPLHYLNLLRRLQQEQPSKTIIEQFGAGYQDYLQAPLQPLTDNLESITYEVFEKDPVKYDLYSRAIERALLDWKQQNKKSSGPQGQVVVAVVGAGRGPLVMRAIQASAATGVPIDLWALEKNQNAFVLLERHNSATWGNQVRLVRSDMRSWRGPFRLLEQMNGAGPTPNSNPIVQHYPIDIVISELLGSFADNELSPECLDGITHLLNPAHGLSIPCDYTAFCTPVAAPKLHTDISGRGVTDKEAPNTPYVVMLQAIDYLSNATESHANAGSGMATVTTQPSPVVIPMWTFSHGNRQPRPSKGNEHNARQTRKSFFIKDRGLCHGLAGFFEATLYPGVELSTHPATMEAKSPDMMSWFPIFFPLKEPLYCPDGTTLTVSMFRKSDGRKVWYEWLLEASVDVPHRNGGELDHKRMRIGISDVMSSKERGCMM